MPKSMLLKSESCASSLFDPTGHYSLAQYCSDKGIAYPEFGTPVSRELFAQYALSFQQSLVPNVEDVRVTTIDRACDGFELRLNSGETLHAEKIVVATGMDHMAYIPGELTQLPTELCSHTADYSDFKSLKGKDVIVVGAGQSALETASATRRSSTALVGLLIREYRNPSASKSNNAAACSALSNAYATVWYIGTATALVVGSASYPLCIAIVSILGEAIEGYVDVVVPDWT
jgi:cation diffusion facilitator CzcD-associated flavoprotein CzcO